MPTHSKFIDLITKKYTNLNLEQDLNALPQPPAPGAPPPIEAPPVNIPEAEPEVTQLTSEGEVELIRLVRKALVLDLDQGSIPPEILDEDINEKNGREILAKIKAFMGTYSDDPNINY
jgi:hypothetical protein